MRKLLLASLTSLTLLAPAHAASGILNWTIPAAPTGQTLTAIQIYDQPTITGLPAPNTMLASLGPTLTTYTTAQLQAGTHAFTAVLVYGANSGAPSNTATLTVTLTLPSIANLTVTLGP